METSARILIGSIGYRAPTALALPPTAAQTAISLQASIARTRIRNSIAIKVCKESSELWDVVTPGWHVAADGLCGGADRLHQCRPPRWGHQADHVRHQWR